MNAVRPVDEETWWEVARVAPGASFFQGPLWARLAAAGTPGLRPAGVGLTAPGGARVVLPLVEIGRRMRGRFAETESTWAGCYGGLVADRALAPEEYRAAWRTLLRQPGLGRLHLTGDPFGPDPGPEVPPRAVDATHAVDVARGWARIEAGFSTGHRRSVRRAAGAGLTVAPAETLDDYRAYFEVYADARRRWAERATNDHPWSLFAAGHALAAEHPGALVLWLCRDPGREVVAGAWVFTWGARATYWHGASRTAALDRNPGHLLHAEILRDAAGRGLAWYDFNPSGGHPGVARFKAGFGALERPVPRWRLEGRAFRSIRAVLDALRRDGGVRR